MSTQHNVNSVYVFLGAGWRCPFLFGVAKCLTDNNVHIQDGTIFLGLSIGASVTHSIIHDIVDDAYTIGINTKWRFFGMSSFPCDVLRKCNTSKSPNGKNIIGLTLCNRLPYNPFDLTPIFKDSFSTLDEELDTIRASCHIPIINGSYGYCIENNTTDDPSNIYLDGEISIHSLVVKEYLYKKYGTHLNICIVDVDMENEQADIRPSKHTSSFYKLFRQKTHDMDNMFKDGYNQCLLYLNN